MNKVKLIRSHLLVFVIGLIVGSIGIVIAESINSNEVLYDNTNSNTSSDNVQDAIDEMYNIIEHNSTGFSLLTRNPKGLSSELVAGLYRYQGVHANNTVDNYICFGTTNKSDCVSDTDKYMYRIIGINTSGQMKLIKKEALNTTYQWASNTGIDWAHSSLYANLNGSYFLTDTNYVPDSSWSNRIAVSDWHYYTSTDSTISTIAERELGAGTVNAKIGLMYLHDYAYTLATPAYSQTSWIHLSNNGASNAHEWTITRANDLRVWRVVSSGNVDLTNDSGITRTAFVRPVFFLKATETIASGSGTITDPYILS